MKMNKKRGVLGWFERIVDYLFLAFVVYIIIATIMGVFK